jgi:hypothetical protein
MTDATTFYRNIVAQVTQFTTSADQVRLISDRIGADSTLSAKLAQAAQASGRSDLATADFDNLKAAIDAINNLLNSGSPGVNTATVKLAFYEIL